MLQLAGHPGRAKGQWSAAWEQCDVPWHRSSPSIAIEALSTCSWPACQLEWYVIVRLPSVASCLVRLQYDVVLLLGPGILPDVGIEVVVPSLPALLADAAGQVGCYGTPKVGNSNTTVRQSSAGTGHMLSCSIIGSAYERV